MRHSPDLTGKDDRPRRPSRVGWKKDFRRAATRYDKLAPPTSVQQSPWQASSRSDLD
jgi:hypothetical protein